MATIEIFTALYVGIGWGHWIGTLKNVLHFSRRTEAGSQSTGSTVGSQSTGSTVYRSLNTHTYIRASIEAQF